MKFKPGDRVFWVDAKKRKRYEIVSINKIDGTVHFIKRGNSNGGYCYESDLTLANIIKSKSKMARIRAWVHMHHTIPYAISECKATKWHIPCHILINKKYLEGRKK